MHLYDGKQCVALRCVVFTFASSFVRVSINSMALEMFTLTEQPNVIAYVRVHLFAFLFLFSFSFRINIHSLKCQRFEEWKASKRKLIRFDAFARKNASHFCD